jgi:hypothetical protein
VGGGADELGWEGQLGVEVVAAEHLPKKDLLGKCDAMVVVHFMHKQHETEVRKRQYHPRWECKFVFDMTGDDEPTHFPRRDARSSALVFKVWVGGWWVGGWWVGGWVGWVWVCVYIHTCIHTCMHTYRHTYIHTYVYIPTYAHTHTHTHTHTCT